MKMLTEQDLILWEKYSMSYIQIQVFPVQQTALFLMMLS